MEFSISAIIDSIKESLSEYDYERTKSHLGFIESSFKSQKAELALKLNNSLKDCSILTKELEHYKKDHGELLLANSESSNVLNRSKTIIAEAEHEVQRLNNEVGMLKKQNMHLSEENGCLEGKTTKLGEELRGCKVQCEGLKEKVVKLEEREKEKNSRFEMEKARLERRLCSVMTAANERFRSFEKRVSALERVVADDDSDSGSQLIDTVLQDQEQEQESREVPHTEEKIAASMPSCPSPKAIRLTDIPGQSESYESDTRPAGHVDTETVAETLDAEENLASAMPCIHKSQSASPTVVDLTCSDDDDGELPSPKGTKRKLSSAVVSTKEEDGGSSIKYRLKQCEQKIEVIHS
ncbi:uncharacterized protein LOC110722658 [Chenopodium quinoa]|uniref:uncharacterized protein LOC110722658 n=1 Tax=Chenopodium quinoa TaxID=63459 RepID=UPI000B779149|nr:uncharacterized protein LOC110722658 [Chenopodium quinoa]